MKKRYSVTTLVFMLLCAGIAFAQYPLLDMAADKVVQKYQSATCEQLWQERAQRQGNPKTPQEQEFVQILRNNPQMRADFINKVAAPIANKMFDCGMIP